MNSFEGFTQDTLILKVAKSKALIRMPLCELAIKGKLLKDKLLEDKIVIAVPSTKDDNGDEVVEELTFSHTKFKTFLNQWWNKNGIEEFSKVYGLVEDFVIQPEGDDMLQATAKFIEKYNS